MDQKTVEHLTTIALRLIGVATILIGLIITTLTIFQLIAAQSAISGFPQGMPPGMSINLKGALGRVGYWALAGQVAIVVWGWLLTVFAQPIAKSISRQ